MVLSMVTDGMMMDARDNNNFIAGHQHRYSDRDATQPKVHFSLYVQTRDVYESRLGSGVWYVRIGGWGKGGVLTMLGSGI